MSATKILILGGEDDEHARHMRDYLAVRGHEVHFLDSRWFPENLRLTYHPTAGRGAIGLPCGRSIAFEQIAAVYWRNYYGVPGPDLPDPEQAWIAHNDARGLFESLLEQLPTRWVNGWNAYRLHQTKPVQLARVAALGIELPPTLLTNDPSAVQAFVARHPQAIVKPVQGGDYTQPLTAANLQTENLLNLRWAPITVQAAVSGTNVRVFVAGEQVLACEVRTGKLDYREDPQAELLVHELPAPTQDVCRRIARELELLWTGIDFRLTPDGRYVFLEANPSPMFLGFEAQTGLPLTAALANLLVGL